MKISLLFGCLFSISVFATERPNVIFLLCDDLGYGDVGFSWQVRRPSGVVRIATPNIDRLAAEGTVLSQHYCAAPVCAPSRASILTGRLQLGEAGRKSGEGCSLINNEFDRAIAETTTLGTVMKAAGYRTYAIGKWGVGGGGQGGMACTAHPLARGFDRFYGFLFHMAGHTYYHYDGGIGGVYAGVYESGEKPGDLPAAFEPAVNPDPAHPASPRNWDVPGYWRATRATAVGRYSTDLFVARAKKYIEDQLNDAEGRNCPFFMYFAINTIHGSGQGAQNDTLADKSNLHVPGGPYVSSHKADGSAIWPLPVESRSVRNTWIDPRYRGRGLEPAAQRYATAITRMDDALGDLVDFLKRKGIYEKTIIVFTSDNGPAAEYGADPRTFESYGPFDGLKRDVYEGGLRVPTFVCWPGHRAKDVETAPSISADWLPALEKLANADRPELPIPVSGRIECYCVHGGGGSAYANEFHARKGNENCANAGYGRDQWMKREGDVVSLKAGRLFTDDTPRRFNVVADPHQDHPLVR